MNLKNRTGNISRLFIPALAILFVLSLSVHSHAFYLDSSSAQDAYQTELESPNHSVEFCSACRLNGNVKPHGIIASLNFSRYEILRNFLSLDVLIQSSFLTLSGSLRSPPAA